jgi:hypothetical protein
MHLLSHLSLLAGDTVYFLHHLLKASIVAALVFQGPNVAPLPFPDNLLADGDIDYHTLWDSDSWNQHIWQFVPSENCSSLPFRYSIMAFPVLLLVVMVPVLTSRDRCFIHLDIGWGGSNIVGCSTSFLVTIHINQESTVITVMFAPPPGPTGLPDI